LYLDSDQKYVWKYIKIILELISDHLSGRPHSPGDGARPLSNLCLHI